FILMLEVGSHSKATVFASELSDLSNSLQPGEWAKLNSIGFGDGDLLKTGGRKVIDYAESGVWDPFGKRFMFIGGGHANYYKFIVYNDVTNTWKTLPMPLSCMNDRTCTGHGYDLNTIDLEGKRFYWRDRPRSGLFYMDLNTDQWGTIDSPTEDSNYTRAHRYGAMTWFPELNGLISVVKDKMYYYNQADGSFTPKGGFSLYGIHTFAEYNPMHKVLFFGGGNYKPEKYDGHPLYKMDATGAITRLNDAPFYVRITSGASGSEGSLVTYEPVSGTFIVLRSMNDSGSSELWEYDITLDKWSFITADFPLGTNGVSAPISNYGVIMFVGRNEIYIYKHKKCVDCINLEKPSMPLNLKMTIEE
ncbi:hypothetical protein MNBD_NITROSPIRAE01-17, partial [hydrothermal vent metagenome]